MAPFWDQQNGLYKVPPKITETPQAWVVAVFLKFQTSSNQAIEEIRYFLAS
jgi:hypothetical protein